DRFTLSGLKQFISFIEIALLVFGGVAVFVGAFTISNTLSITVAQRSRELAMLRTVGATRRQVLGSVVLEALVVGVGASLVGLFASGVSVGTRFTLIGPGCVLLFVGVALLSRRIAVPLASVLGRPARRLGGSAGALARGNAMRNPARTSSTAAALMIGVAL